MTTTNIKAANAAAANATRTVVFIHGAWMTPQSWDKFRQPFEAAGYTVLAPTWPHLDKSVAELRAGKNEELGKVGVNDIADHYQAIIEKLAEAPLLVGHSFGGLIVQMLLDRGLGVAGIAIDPGPIAGAIADPISLGAAFPVIARFNGWNTAFMLSREAFADRFANTVPEAERNAAYDKLVVPAPGRIFYEAALMIGTNVHTAQRKQPLLLISAEKDRTVAPALVRSIFNVQKKSSARTDMQSFAGLSHFLIAETGYKKVAAFALNWADEVLAH
jgi:pimeloyl-ACP methyl ester carboxylesterase